jgi:hypothetical protein
MRIAAITGLVMLWALSPGHYAAKAANDAPWCYRQFGAPQYSNCTYYSAHQCLLVARYMLDGGVCERNHLPVQQPQAPKIKHRPRS